MADRLQSIKTWVMEALDLDKSADRTTSRLFTAFTVLSVAIIIAFTVYGGLRALNSAQNPAVDTRQVIMDELSVPGVLVSGGVANIKRLAIVYQNETHVDSFDFGLTGCASLDLFEYAPGYNFGPAFNVSACTLEPNTVITGAYPPPRLFHRPPNLFSNVSPLASVTIFLDLHLPEDSLVSIVEPVIGLFNREQAEDIDLAVWGPSPGGDQPFAPRMDFVFGTGKLNARAIMYMQPENFRSLHGKKKWLYPLEIIQLTPITFSNTSTTWDSIVTVVPRTFLVQESSEYISYSVFDMFATIGGVVGLLASVRRFLFTFEDEESERRQILYARWSGAWRRRSKNVRRDRLGTSGTELRHRLVTAEE